MTSSEVLTGFRVIAADLHVGVAETNYLFLPVLTGLNDGLFSALNITARLVALHPLLRKSLSFRSISHD